MGRGKRRQGQMGSTSAVISITALTDPPLCLSCVHYSDETEFTCAAFLSGIPKDILLNLADHRHSYPGDHGLRYVPNAPGEPDPDPFEDDE
jgi:hypothetical protein